MPRTKTVSNDEVLRLALEVILDQGPNVPTSKIAAHVGLSQPTLFQRFGDKQTLISLALRPNPVDPQVIIGRSDEVTKFGTGGHFALLAGRLFDAMLEVMERLQINTVSKMMNPESSKKAHSASDAESLIMAIESHIESLPNLKASAKLVTTALMMLVHGAVAQALQQPNRQGRRMARKHLVEVIRLFFEPSTESQSFGLR